MGLKEKRCPYCKKRANYFNLLKRKSNVYYYCESCKKYSLLRMNENIKIVFTILVSLSVLLIILFSFFINLCLLGSVIILFLFSLFYFAIPFFIDIKPQED